MKILKRLPAVLLGIVLSLPLYGIAFDIPEDGNPSVKDGGLYAVKNGTTNTKQNLTSTNGALDVNIASGSTTPPTGASATQVQGTAAAGAAPVGNPLQAGVYDGTNMRRAKGDETGGTWVQGPAAQGAAAAGNPLRNGGLYLSNANQLAVTTGQMATLQTDPAGNLRTAPQRPTAGDILAANASVTATTASTALITISAGRTWVGTGCISVAGSKAAAATGNGEVLGSFLTAGANVTPAAGTYFQVDTAIGANAATGVVGSNGSSSNCTQLTVVAPAGNSATVNYASTCTNTTACRISVSAIGVMQ